MSISRRHFLRAGGVAVIAAGAATSINAKTNAPGSDTAVPIEQLALMSKASFAAHLNSIFLIRPREGQEVPVELIALRDFTPPKVAAARTGQECFALVFRPRARQTLKQNTYQIEHRALGQFQLLLAPVKSQKHGQIYQAVINHVRA